MPPLPGAFGKAEPIVSPVDGSSIKKDSPSSGLFRVKVYNEHGMARKDGTGMFPREVMNRFPLLPLEEEGRLNDMPLRENCIDRVFAYYRWTGMLNKEPTPGGPVFWDDPDGNEIIVAVTSSGDGQCVATGLNYRVDIPYMLQWIYDQIPGEG